MTLNDLLHILIKMNQEKDVDGDAEVVIEYDGPDTRGYHAIESVNYNEIYKRIELDGRFD